MLAIAGVSLLFIFYTKVRNSVLLIEYLVRMKCLKLAVTMVL